MERIITWARENPQFAALTLGASVLVVVTTLLGIMMVRAGTSLRPIIWFLGFFGIVAGPQAAIHLLDGFVRRHAAQAQMIAATAATTPVALGTMLTPVPWTTVFGPTADPALITDAKASLTEILGEALEARLSFNVNGESALAARFSSVAAATRALGAYGKFFAVAQAQGSDASGWTARRHGGQGEWVHVAVAGAELYAWTSASRENVLANRVRALGPVPDDQPDAIETSRAGEPARLVSGRLTAKPVLMSAIVALNLFGAVFWFFKGSAWAARVSPGTVASATPASSLRGELLALNRSDGPMEVTPQADGSLEINWRYATRGGSISCGCIGGSASSGWSSRSTSPIASCACGSIGAHSMPRRDRLRCGSSGR